MNLSELSIKRHVLAFMLSAIFVLVGFIAYKRIGIDRFPTIEFPVISITTVLKGGSPDVIDASVTNILETAANSIPGIQHIQSFSSPSVSTIAITFNLEKNVDVGFNEVQAKVNQVLNQLPKGIDPPIVAKVEMNASPIIWLSLHGDRTLQQLNLYAANVLKKKLETIDGVGTVLIGGKNERTIRVYLSLNKMASFNVSGQDVMNAFTREHVQFPGGFLVGKNTEALLNLDSEFHHIDDLQKMIITYRDNAPIRLKDIAVIEDGLEDFRQVARFNQQPTVGLGIIKVPNSNTVAIVDAIKERLNNELIPQLPPGMKLSIATNDATYIQEKIDTLKEHLVEGTLLAALVVWLFLRSISSTLIISTAIPVSLMGAIGAMYFCGYTFNVMTMLALLLLIGVVVDDAIVVLENIYRHREDKQKSPFEAAILGSKQVFFAVLAASLALVSIFAPVIFLGGIIGKFFQSFAVVVTVGVLVSLFVSVTLTPMLCSRFLKVSDHHHNKSENKLDKTYRQLLAKALAHRWKVLGTTFLIFLLSGYFFASIGKGFVPEEDEGRFLISFRTPLGANIHYTNEKLAQIETLLAKYPEVETNFSAIGLGQAGQVNQGMCFVSLKPKEERKRKQHTIVKSLRDDLAQIPGIQAFAGPVPIIGGQRGEALQFALVGPNLPLVANLSQKLQQNLSKYPLIGNVDLTLQLDLPQYDLKIDRTKAANVGLGSDNIALAINLLSGGLNIAKFNDAGDGQRYDIRLKAQENEINTQTDFAKIFLKARNGELVRLDTIAEFKQTLGPAVISRLDLQYAASFFSAPKIPLGEAVNLVQAEAKTILPPGYHIQFLGQAEEFAKTAKYMSFTFLLALILLYMVLASQFNSFIQPLLVMAAQPLAIIGGVFALWLTNQTLNIYSMIGLVLLIGLVAKNSILLVDLTNQYRGEGQDVNSALIKACPQRLRPILMTSLTVILALLPAALGLGAGSETNAPLAIAVIGGMVSSTLLTLVVVPALYSLVLTKQPRQTQFTQIILQRVYTQASKLWTRKSRFIS